MKRALARTIRNWLRRLGTGRRARPADLQGRASPAAQETRNADADGFDADGVRILGPRQREPRRTGMDVPVGDIERLVDLDVAPPRPSRAGPASGGLADQVELPFEDAPAPPAPVHSPGATAQTAEPGEDPTELKLGAGELIISLYVMSRDRQAFDPLLVKQALDGAGLSLGKMNIYHHQGVGESQAARPVFSAASAVEPGTFDASVPGSYATPGLVLFMRLPGRQDGRVTFELMLHTAERLAEDLGAVLLDDRRSTLSAQAVNSLRENVTEFGRRQQLAARSA